MELTFNSGEKSSKYGMHASLVSCTRQISVTSGSWLWI